MHVLHGVSAEHSGVTAAEAGDAAGVPVRYAGQGAARERQGGSGMERDRRRRRNEVVSADQAVMEQTVLIHAQLVGHSGEAAGAGWQTSKAALGGGGGGAGLAWHGVVGLELSGPPYAVLERGAFTFRRRQIIAQLQKLGIAYQLQAAGNVSLVPAPQLAEARLQPGAGASAGLGYANRLEPA